jgi:SAM-dependent methyltransferase
VKQEAEDMVRRYARRSTRYDPWMPWVYMARQEFERGVIRTLSRAGHLPAGDRAVLEVGCGHGSNLRLLLGLGFSPERIVGCELIEGRAASARTALPAAVRIVQGDATAVNLPDASFDIVLQSLVFSSILDDSFQVALAERMWGLVRPGGGILWYDFVYDNPANADVRGVTVRRVRELFPVGPSSVEWLTLAPPIARRATTIHPALYGLLNVIAPLRTHRLCWIPKH